MSGGARVSVPVVQAYLPGSQWKFPTLDAPGRISFQSGTSLDLIHWAVCGAGAARRGGGVRRPHRRAPRIPGDQSFPVWAERKRKRGRRPEVSLSRFYVDWAYVFVVPYLIVFGFRGVENISLAV